MEDNLNFWEMEDDLHFSKMEDDLIILENGRRPKYHIPNGIPHQFLFKWNVAQLSPSLSFFFLLLSALLFSQKELS